MGAYRIKRLLLSVLLSLTFALGLSVTQAGAETRQFLSLYEGLLASHVRPATQSEIAFAGVDYDAWGEDPRHQRALEHLLRRGPPSDALEDVRMAYWINAYNFLTIDLIVRENERDSIRNLGGLFSSPWTKFEWAIEGQDYTLDFIEHEILRPMGDPRIHFAINCASVSCPDLRTEPYTAEKLDNQLDEQVQDMLANPGKGLWQDGNKIYVSKILDWFSEDFDDGDVEGWVRRYANTPDQFSLRYLKYDWALNLVR